MVVGLAKGKASMLKVEDERQCGKEMRTPLCKVELTVVSGLV
jgi:hypothetical protein